MKKEDEVQNDSIEFVEVEQRRLGHSGFWLSIVALFVSFHGIVSLVALILSFIQLSKARENSKNGKMALWGIIISLIGLGYASLRMIGVL